MKPTPTPKPGWVVIAPDGTPLCWTRDLHRSGAILQWCELTERDWEPARRLGYRVRRCQVTK